ncbi:ATP-binding cassette domain-containing protein [Desulfosporosinus sp. BICA1-9]|uniref:ABC transporter ATP-binding protein n=1 Tax=Desulfosporosinus sp. BICA1-9 TaxID=1531958 RepID=UPI00054B6BC4|nr:ATP-binding cassette domain-containing protein [Desulfosporosinus sp. BICA1-9]KJS47548.1 MAG: ABC transporter ATP-binding protein [Peptococcaceae bacterium BRH_c23]KJS89231.1 MAG: ABC transporter ATP-binding protein [Desulfosporosinus sp. BICA1-9]HBW35417.1 ABC transporter ATP-binding protein [Desulfosporosinus sp.]
MFTLRGVKYKDILDINELDIPEQRITCIVGESGSGKTTLLRLLNHLISYDEGEICFQKTPLSLWNPIELRRKVMMLSQSPAIFEGTVRDNLLIGFKFCEKPPVEDSQLQDALEIVRFHKDLSQDSNSLSGGEKQRLALARVLLLEPQVFLLDEPSSALDEETTQFVMEQLVQHVKHLKKTMLMVTHSKAVVQAFAEHVVETKKGKIVLTKEA